MKPILILLFVTLFPFAASAQDTTGECVADTWKNEGTIDEMFGEPWPPGIDNLLALGCVSEDELLKRFFGSTFEETHARTVACDNGWHAIHHFVDGREEKGVVRLYKEGKVVAGMYSPNLNSMSPILYSYIFIRPDTVRVMQIRALETVLQSQFAPVPNSCVVEKD